MQILKSVYSVVFVYYTMKNSARSLFISCVI